MEGSMIVVCVITLIRLQAVSGVYRYGDVSQGAAFLCRCTEGCYPDNGTCISGGCQASLPLGYGWEGDCCRVGNVAFGKVASQSGTFQGLHAGLAVDGRVGPGRSSEQCAYPRDNSDNRAWWYVDLGTVHVIYNVTLYNMDDYYYETLSDFRIHVGNNSNVASNPICHEQDRTPVPVRGSQNFECPNPMYGRYVGFRRNERKPGVFDASFATLCEVVAIGRAVKDCSRCPMASPCDNYHGCYQCQSGTRLPDCKQECGAGRFGLNCEGTCSSHCKTPRVCDVTNGTCLTGCHGSPDDDSADWWLGDTCDVYVPSLDTLSIRNLATTVVSMRSVGLKWTDSLNISDLAIRYFGFYVYYRYEDETQWTLGGQVAYSTNIWTTFELTNLKPDTTVIITVSAIRISPKGLIQARAIDEASNIFLVVTRKPERDEPRGTTDPSDVEQGRLTGAVTGGTVSGVVIIGITIVIVAVFLRQSSSQRESQSQQTTEGNQNKKSQTIMDETGSPAMESPILKHDYLALGENPEAPNEYEQIGDIHPLI